MTEDFLGVRRMEKGYWHRTPPPDTPKEQLDWFKSAFYVPGHGWYGGFSSDLADLIVTAINSLIDKE